MEQVTAVVLAAGEGKRMKSKYAKVTHEICGKSLIEWVCTAVRSAGVQDVVVVVGDRADQVKERMGDTVRYAFQEVQLGTAHAVMQAEECIRSGGEHVLVLYGDIPLISPQTVREMLEFHLTGNFAATVVTAELENSQGYGRIVRDAEGNICRIVEQRDATLKELEIKEVNSGIYCYGKRHLLESLKQLGRDNDQGEYYLTDTIEVLIKNGLSIGTYKVKDSSEIMGINDRAQLSEAREIKRKKIMHELMKSGVTIIHPDSTHIDDGVEIGIDTVIYPNTIIEGKTVIGEDCTIGPNTRIVSCAIGNGVSINNAVVLISSVENGAQIGPFAYIRPESSIGSMVKVGDFVEIKKSRIDSKTKIPHLAYIGDAEIGRNTNIACGVITVNYDGRKKHRTIIGNNAFVGCNVNLIAPVEVKDNSYIAAGSTITEEVPEYSLAIARSRQVNKDDWVRRKGMERKET